MELLLASSPAFWVGAVLIVVGVAASLAWVVHREMRRCEACRKVRKRRSAFRIGRGMVAICGSCGHEPGSPIKVRAGRKYRRSKRTAKPLGAKQQRQPETHVLPRPSWRHWRSQEAVN